MTVVGTALLTAWFLIACGGDPASTNPSSSRQASAETESSEQVKTGPLKVVGGGSASYRNPDHHPGVPGFGEEAGKAELRAAALTEHGYLVARVEQDWPKACTYVSKGLMRTLMAQSEKLSGQSCATILAAVTEPGPGGSDYESSEVEAQSLRIRSKHAFLLYRAATAPYFMPMVQEGGAWKVASLDPTAFFT